MKGNCRLCLKPNKLCESHIFPKFMVKNIRSEINHKFEFVTNKPLKRKPQDGPKEYLLCESCEQQLCTFEKYFNEYFSAKNKSIKLISLENNTIRIEGYDYNKIKLFLLSVLWRLSITSIPDFHIHIKIKQEEILRNMIINKNAGEVDDFPFYTTLVKSPVLGYDSEIFCNPFGLNLLNNSVYVYMYGILFLCSVKMKNKYFNNSDLLISPTNWTVHIKSLHDITVLDNHLQKGFSSKT